MNCDVCQSAEATVYFSQLIEGKLKKVNLCKSCAEDKGVTDPTGFALADMLHGMGEESVTEKRPSAPGEKVCDECGFSQADFKKTGRFGCSHCYEVFSEGLENLLEAMHKSTQHEGKVPRRFEETKAKREQLSDLRAKLQEAVASEDFEEAARLRDAIAKTEAEDESGAGSDARSEDES